MLALNLGSLLEAMMALGLSLGVYGHTEGDRGKSLGYLDDQDGGCNGVDKYILRFTLQSWNKFLLQNLTLQK